MDALCSIPVLNLSPPGAALDPAAKDAVPKLLLANWLLANWLPPICFGMRPGVVLGAADIWLTES